MDTKPGSAKIPGQITKDQQWEPTKILWGIMVIKHNPNKQKRVLKMATISPESQTRPVDDSDPEPVGVTKDQANETVEPQTYPVPSNGRYRRATGFAIGEWAPVPTEEIDNIIVKLHESQRDIDTLNRRRLWLLKNKHKPAAEVMERIRQIELEYTNTEGVTRRPIRKAQIFHNEFQSLQDYLSLVETDQKENQVQIESLLEETAQQTENEGEPPDSRPNGGYSLAEIASELDEARQTDEWYSAEKQSVNDRLDAIDRQIREQPEIAGLLKKCEDLLLLLQVVRDDLETIEVTVIEEDPELAEAVAKLSQARQDSAQVQERIKRTTHDITPEDSARIQEVLDCWRVNMKPEEMGNWQRNPPTTTEARRMNEQLLGADWRELVGRPNYSYYCFKKLLEDRKHPDKTKRDRL